ncbi:universal stress protein [Rubrimonas cliftonensis]|uniref:Nucleotide-binding universal stress protein, UspA family n=1 Tax=Rubrimonas cliftonensis TaxID=89524 RepID=A0A1H4EJF9_9RHOB|nr:universal stress protein [Rubrimonas cliftonensis]SEA85076.1 Nucleotide-binding universal stress protein, UspA family [Rubrimonas cliftonensis]
MYDAIMVPVDLAHADKLDKALSVAADLAKLYAAPICYVGVTAATPGSVAHSPREYEQKLGAFARAQAEARGVEATSRALVSHDPAVDLDEALLDAVRETGADLVVMASHVPGLLDAVWPSHGGALASHASTSVMLVR